MKKYRVGIIGFGHMHINNVAALFAKHPQVEMAACADTVPVKPEIKVAPYTRAWNKNFALTELGVAKAYDSYQEMLDKEQLDIVIVTSRTLATLRSSRRARRPGPTSASRSRWPNALRCAAYGAPARPRHGVDRKLAPDLVAGCSQGQGAH